MPTARPLPPVIAGGPFTVRAALGLGVSAGELRRATLTSPFWGVREQTTGPDDVVARCRAALQVLPDGAVFSHVTALRLREIEVPWSLERDNLLHVVVPTRSGRPQRPQIRAHVSGRIDPARSPICGLAVTSPAQTWLHLAAALDLGELVVLGDAMLRRKLPPTTWGALEDAAAASSGARGVRTARLALPLLRSGTDSSMESRARLVLVHAGLPCPEVNTPVLDAWGRFVALPDLSYPELRIAIEYDGDVHRTDARTWRRDIARREALQALGWRIITLTADDVIRFPTRMVSWVRAAINARA
ncbi:endonuclease domain-containing protein [Pengzhenrongella frigida]|uniref:DUF559 domain-containing protein n=1 Tax=Pengzhenrongella frigida TaxID=1259133 RepID=A0A4Q5N383_9MICO|nr:hypothetical protein [Cellulomonas sp. HLT2-17]RYV52586.1 hypothetical protein EUA98_02475 [Cellulomonas sp. HLT2-17]